MHSFVESCHFGPRHRFSVSCARPCAAECGCKGPGDSASFLMFATGVVRMSSGQICLNHFLAAQPACNLLDVIQVVCHLVVHRIRELFPFTSLLCVCSSCRFLRPALDCVTQFHSGDPLCIHQLVRDETSKTFLEVRVTRLLSSIPPGENRSPRLHECW